MEGEKKHPDPRLDGRVFSCHQNDGGSCTKQALNRRPICVGCPHLEPAP